MQLRKDAPALASIEGRADDLLYTADGREVGRLNPIFKARLPVREAQIIQETVTRIRLRSAPTAGFNRSVAQSLERRLRDRLGQVEVCFEAVDEVPREKNGKFRTVICLLSREEKERLRNARQRSAYTRFVDRTAY